MNKLKISFMKILKRVISLFRINPDLTRKVYSHTREGIAYFVNARHSAYLKKARNQGLKEMAKVKKRNRDLLA